MTKTEDLITNAILSRVKKPIGISQVGVVEEIHERAIHIVETQEQLLKRLSEMERLIWVQYEIYTKKEELRNRSDLLYLIHLAGPTGVALLILGSTISIYGWLSGLISVGLAGLGPWAVVLADILSRVKKR